MCSPKILVAFVPVRFYFGFTAAHFFTLLGGPCWPIALILIFSPLRNFHVFFSNEIRLFQF